MMSTIKSLKSILKEAEALVIGAGAGLSTAAGFQYDKETFLKYFQYMHDAYGYEDMYTAGFHPFQSSEEKWAYWAKFIDLNRYESGSKALYQELYQFVKDKNYFVITTNVDHQFQLAGFDKKRLFYTQGDYGLFQCSKACHLKTYDNEAMIKKMVAQTKNHRIPTELIPRCPVCHEEMEPNLRKDEFFVQDQGWEIAKKRYMQFIQENKDKKIVFLELGVGYNTPGIIKIPFMQMTYQFQNAWYICVNQNDMFIPKEIKDKTIFIKEGLKSFIKILNS